MKDYTPLKWICGTIVICVFSIMYFSIFPRTLTFDINTNEELTKTFEIANNISQRQYDNQNFQLCPTNTTFKQIPCECQINTSNPCMVYCFKCTEEGK